MVRPHVCHVITGLPVGGAQSVLYRLVAQRQRLGCAMSVVSLTERGEVGAALGKLGVEIRALEMSRRLPDPTVLRRLARLYRELGADVVQTWLYHGDLIGGLAARWAGVSRLYWNLRQTDLDPAGSRRSTVWTARACALLSRRLPDRIVACSEASRRVHAALGYDASRMLVIGNGIDLELFRPDAEARAALRRELGIAHDARVVGHVGRFHPQKDHAGFLAAAEQLNGGPEDAVLVLAGAGVDEANPGLRRLVQAAGLEGRVRLLGRRDDMARLYPVLDLLVSSAAFGEGFPNVLIEAMACGVPCIATDVGDSAAIVADTGWSVPPRRPDLLAAALREALAESCEARLARGRAARRRAEARYGLDVMLEAYGRLYAA